MSKTTQFSIRLPNEIIKRIDEIAGEQTRTRSNLIEHYVRKSIIEKDLKISESKRPFKNGENQKSDTCEICGVVLTKHSGYNGQSGWIPSPWTECKNASCKGNKE